MEGSVVEDEDYIWPYMLGAGWGTTLSPAPNDLPKEKIKQKQRIGFHSVKKAKNNGRRTP